MDCVRLPAAGLLVVLLWALAAFSAAGAEADTIRLRSGQVLEVASVEVLEDGLRLGIKKDGEVTQVDLGFDRLEPKYLLKVLDRYVDPDSASQRLLTARVALQVGLLEQAKQRFQQALQLDAALKEVCEAGLLEVEKQGAAKVLKRLEDRLRKTKEPKAVLKRLEAFLAGPYADVLTEVQRQRINLLIRLARRMVLRDEEREAAKVNPPAPVPPGKAGGTAGDGTPPTEEGSGSVPGGRTYFDERWRARRGPRRAPPSLPGANRPAPRNGSGGASSPSGGRGAPSGGAQGAGAAGGAGLGAGGLGR